MTYNDDDARPLDLAETRAWVDTVGALLEDDEPTPEPSPARRVDGWRRWVQMGVDASIPAPRMVRALDWDYDPATDRSRHR